MYVNCFPILEMVYSLENKKIWHKNICGNCIWPSIWGNQYCTPDDHNHKESVKCYSWVSNPIIGYYNHGKNIEWELFYILKIKK